MDFDTKIGHCAALPGLASKVMHGRFITHAEDQPFWSWRQGSGDPVQLHGVVHEFVLLGDLGRALMCPALDEYSKVRVGSIEFHACSR